MTETIDLFEAIDTQRGIRYFRPDPVPDELITRLLQAAIKAPSGGARQDGASSLYETPKPGARLGSFTEQGRSLRSGRT